MSAAQVGLATAAAVAAQTALAWSVTGAAVNLDLPLVVVVLAAISGGSLTGLWTGTAAGLAQDVLSGGIVGVNGLCKSVVGVAAGLAGERLLLTTAWQRSLMLAAATALHAVCFFGTYAFISTTTPIGDWPDVGAQAVANALAGALAVGMAGHVRRRRRRAPRRGAPAPARWRTGYAS